MPHDEQAHKTDVPTFAKEQLRTHGAESMLLGMSWDREKDTLSVVLDKERKATTTKRGALSNLAGVYDPLGLVSPTTLQGKLIYWGMCEERLGWDQEFHDPLKKRWAEWYERLPDQYTVPRALTPYQEPVQLTCLHGFGDASKDGVSAVVYAVTKQESGTTQGIVCSKSRIAKKNLSIPRLELVAGHMAANLVTNVEQAIGSQKITSVHCWLDSTVALYWISGQGEYRQFVSNRVKKIKGNERIKWHHVPTNENPAHLGSRGGNVTNNILWQLGPEWLTDQARWPPEVVPAVSSEAKEEEKASVPVMVAVDISEFIVLDGGECTSECDNTNSCPFRQSFPKRPPPLPHVQGAEWLAHLDLVRRLTTK